MTKSLILAPEPHKIWVIFPSALYTHEKIIMDKTDYDECLLKNGNSKYHTIISQNLKVLREEGILLIEDYKAYIDIKLKSKIAKFADKIDRNANDKERQKLLFEAYTQYERSSLLKASFLSDNKNELAKHSNLIDRLRVEINKLKSDNWLNSIHSEVNNFVFKQYIWKSIASLIVSSMICKNGNSVIYDNPEYSNFIAHFWRATTHRDQHGKYNNKKAIEKINFYKKAIVELTKILSPYTTTITEKDLFLFLDDRKSFQDIRCLISEIETVYQEIGFNNKELGRNVLENETNRILMILNDEIKKVRSKRKKLWLPVSLFGSSAKNIQELFGGEKKEIMEATKNLEAEFGEDYKWIFALLRLYSPSRMADAERKLLAIRREKKCNQNGWWITGDRTIPWYVNI